MYYKLNEHNIECVIGPKGSINEVFLNWTYSNLLNLKCDFRLIPLTYDLISDMDELADKGETAAHKEFVALSKSVEDVLKENSFSAPLGYIETDYHNGQGRQSAIAYSKGKIIEGPLSSETIWDNNEMKFIDKPSGVGAINKVLYALGLPKRDDMSGFEQLNLGDLSSNKKVLEKIMRTFP